MQGIEHIADTEHDRNLEERKKREIIQRVNQVVNVDRLIEEPPFDIIQTVYDIAYGDGFEACKQEELPWSDFER